MDFSKNITFLNRLYFYSLENGSKIKKRQLILSDFFFSFWSHLFLTILKNPIKIYVLC